MTDEDIAGLEEHDREKVFLEMPEPDRWRVMFSMLAYLRREIPVIKKEQIEFRQELLKRAQIREAREEKMKSTNEKIDEWFSKKFNLGIYMRDKVLPGVIQFALLALLYLIFTKP